MALFWAPVNSFRCNKKIKIGGEYFLFFKKLLSIALPNKKQFDGVTVAPQTLTLLV